MSEEQTYDQITDEVTGQLKKIPKNDKFCMNDDGSLVMDGVTYWPDNGDD